jgi:hypothetical protein
MNNVVRNYTQAAAASLFLPVIPHYPAGLLETDNLA